MLSEGIVLSDEDRGWPPWRSHETTHLERLDLRRAMAGMIRSLQHGSRRSLRRRPLHYLRTSRRDTVKTSRLLRHIAVDHPIRRTITHLDAAFYLLYRPRVV